MTQAKRLEFTTPVGRMVGGSLYEPKKTDADGKPLVIKTGPNAGQPRVEFSFAVAFPKTPGVQHWSQEPSFLGQLWAFGHQMFPNGEAQHPAFAWKITDGDSTIPNKRGKKPCDNEGYKGHWVVWFSGGTAPRIFNRDGSQQLLEKDAVKPGYYVQVFGHATDNKPSQTPGLYMNHSMVALSGIGEEISFGPDVSQAGFGQGVQLPPGATAYTGQPIAPSAAMPATGATPPAPVAPLIPNMTPPPVAAPAPAAPPPAAPAAPARVMLPAANGASYESLIAAGWTDATLVQHGMMQAPAPAVAAPPLAPVGSVPTPAAPAPIVAAPPALPVTPNPAILAVPAAPAAPARVMLPAANGATYEQLIAAGWTDAQLVQHGMMAA